MITIEKKSIKDFKPQPGTEEEARKAVEHSTNRFLWINKPIENPEKLKHLQTWISEYTTKLLPLLVYKCGINELYYFADDYSKWLYETYQENDRVVYIVPKKPKSMPDILDIFKGVLEIQRSGSRGQNKIYYAIYKRILEDYRWGIIKHGGTNFEFVWENLYICRKKKYIDMTEIENYSTYINTDCNDYMKEACFCKELGMKAGANAATPRQSHNTWQLLYGNVKASEAIRAFLTKNYAPRDSYDCDEIKEAIGNSFHIPNKDFYSLIEEFDDLDSDINPTFDSYRTYSERVHQLIDHKILIYKTYQDAKCQEFGDWKIYAICKKFRDFHDEKPIKDWAKISSKDFEKNKDTGMYSPRHRKY
jgi:hypothetical protein